MIGRIRVTWNVEALSDLLNTDAERIPDEVFGDALVLRFGGRGSFSTSFKSLLIHPRPRDWQLVRGQCGVPVNFLQVGPIEAQWAIRPMAPWTPHERPLIKRRSR